MTAERAGAVVGPTDWIDNEGMRMALALERIALSTERIAIALEQLALAQIPEPKSVLQRIAEAPRMGSDLPPDQLPPPPVAPVSVAPAGPSAAFRESRDLPAEQDLSVLIGYAPAFQPMQPNWQAGMVHQNGHKPLKVNPKGIYCPTKMPDDSWCAWRPGR